MRIKLGFLLLYAQKYYTLMCSPAIYICMQKTRLDLTQKSALTVVISVNVMYAETVLIGQTCGFDGTPDLDVFKRSVTIN